MDGFQSDALQTNMHVDDCGPYYPLEGRVIFEPIVHLRALSGVSFLGQNDDLCFESIMHHGQVIILAQK